MKTPREILLAQHQGATPKLDILRRAVVADLKPNPPREPGIPFLLQLWRELIWPCRRMWAGLAAAWLLIVTFNFAQRDVAPVVIAKQESSGAVRLAFHEQRRLLEEIIGANHQPAIAEPPRRPNLQPRSERRSVAMV